MVTLKRYAMTTVPDAIKVEETYWSRLLSPVLPPAATVRIFQGIYSFPGNSCERLRKAEHIESFVRRKKRKSLSSSDSSVTRTSKAMVAHLQEDPQ
jgi:hypothetical protein